MIQNAQIIPQTHSDDALPTYDARELTDKDGRACIMLDGQLYSLRITRSGKLILTK